MSFERYHKKQRIISEINVTPFVDVLLVLLIIFMVAAPMLTSSFDIELPDGSGKENNEKIYPITISLDNSGEIFLEEDKIEKSKLSKKLSDITNQNFERKIYVQADKSIEYGKVMEIIDSIGKAGFKNVMLVTKIPY